MYTENDKNIARYMFELWNNRQSKCESGGDFLRDPEEISYSVESFCRRAGSNDTISMTSTYLYKNCDSKKIESLTLEAAVKYCTENGNPVLNPFKYSVAMVQDMPTNYNCPPEFERLDTDLDQDVDFTREWEFRHAVENVYKYGNNTSSGTSLALMQGCNAYVSTTTDMACYNAKSSQYQGYATIQVECIGNDQIQKVTVYIDGTDLGRSSCPWPEFTEISPGYNPNFNFIDSLSTEITTASSDGDSQERPFGLLAAISCIEQYEIAVISSGPDLILKSQGWNMLNDTDVALAVVEPQTTEQVSQAMDCLFSNGVPVVPKSGGHSYGGYSVLPTAVTIDFSNMRDVTLNQDLTATIQGGARLGMIYYEIWTQSSGQRGVVGGTCPAVGAGHVLGGGIGAFVH